MFFRFWSTSRACHAKRWGAYAAPSLRTYSRVLISRPYYSPFSSKAGWILSTVGVIGTAIGWSTFNSEVRADAKWENPNNLYSIPGLYRYVLSKGVREDPNLVALREETAKLTNARMMAAPEETAFFGFLLKAVHAKKVIEVGVFTGYTTLGLAMSIPEDGKIVALDITDKYPSVGLPFWKKAGVDSKIDLRVGPAVDSLDAMIKNGEAGTYDFSFIDADKVNYEHYYEKLLILVRKGGIIAIDNVLWHGDVLKTDSNDINCITIQNLNEKISRDPRVEIVLLPIADGVTLCRVL